MPEDSNIENTKSLKEQYVLYEKRESQKDSKWEFVKEIGAIALSGVVGAVIGGAAGKFAEVKNVKIKGFPVGKDAGAWLGGKIGAIYGVYNHWKKTEGKRAGIDSVSNDLNETLSPEHIKKEINMQAEIAKDLEKLENIKKGRVSHAENILARREAVENVAGRV
ncbi:MAG: hypothetical protein R3D71_09600 [Rickettsiales bacterium]